MKSKAVIALIFGLVFQLAQSLPGMAALMMDCSPAAESCSCCDIEWSCACADDSEPAPAPLPLGPDSSPSLKAPAAKVTCTRVSLETAAGPHTTAPTVAIMPLTGPWAGYTGVRHSVVFCSFVI